MPLHYRLGNKSETLSRKKERKRQSEREEGRKERKEKSKINELEFFFRVQIPNNIQLLLTEYPVPPDVQQIISLIHTADQTCAFSHIGQIVPKAHNNYTAECS